jgi:hypothetical protein
MPPFLDEIWRALGGAPAAIERVSIARDGWLP